MEKQQEEAFEMGKTNYLLLIAGTVVIGVGFIMMSGGGTENTNEFAGDTLFNTQFSTTWMLQFLARNHCTPTSEISGM